MKADREHRVPLCDRAVAIVREMETVKAQRLRLPRCEARQAAQQHGDADHVAPDGSRRSNGARLPLELQDWAAEETNYQSDVIEMALAHAIGDKVEAAYRRGDLFEKRRSLMDAWAAFCDSRATGNVVALR